MLLLWQKNIADGQKLSFVAVTVQLLYSFNSTHSPIPKLTGNLKKKKEIMPILLTSSRQTEQRSRNSQFFNFGNKSTYTDVK